jgi:small-conductance mechanosensitive channel
MRGPRSLAIALLLAGPTHAQQAPAPESAERTAASEPDLPRAALARIRGLEDVRLDEADAVVRLEGEVATTELRRIAEDVVGRARPDALYIDNRIVVGDAPESGPSEDVALRERIDRILSQIESFDDLEVTVDAGVVHLTGQAYDSEVAEQAVELVRSLDGVIYVDNQVRDVTAVRARVSPALVDLRDRGRAIVDRLPLAVIGIVLVVVVWLLSGAIARFISGRILPGRPLLEVLVTRIVRGVVVLGAIVLAFDLLGVSGMVGGVLGTVGVAGIAVGFAFQDIVENLLAGFMLGLQQPFAQNDVVRIGEHEGKVVRLTLRETVLMTLEGNHLRVPNAVVYKSASLNFTKNPLRRFDFTVGLGMDVVLADALALARETLLQVEGVLEDPGPSTIIDAIGDSAMQVRFYGWLDQRSHDFFAVRSESIRQIKRAFEAREYDMPEPIYRVQMSQFPPTRAAHSEPSGTATPVYAGDPIDGQIEAERASQTDPDLLQPDRDAGGPAKPNG